MELSAPLTPETNALIDERKKNFTGLEVDMVMLKVSLTNEQANQVEDIIAERSVWTELTDLSREELGAALTGNYELIPEPSKFLPGHYVVRKDGYPIEGKKRIGTIERRVKFSYESVSINGGELIRHIHRSKLRHATPEEIYWLENLGREKVGDFKYGDVLKRSGCGDGVMSVVYGMEDGLSIEEAIRFTKIEDFLGIYPAESYKPFPKGEAK